MIFVSRWNNPYRFAPASPTESTVFGAARPAYGKVQTWLAFMQQHQIQRVCCLLPDQQLAGYENLLELYCQSFGAEQLCWTPIEDFRLIDPATLTQKLLPFLLEAERQQQRAVVHCSGGIGRTGQVLAAWLVAARGFSNREAIASVRQMGRNPYEAAIAAPFQGQNPWTMIAELNELLDHCRREFA